MIFQHTWQQVVSGDKWQTRRLVAGNEVLRGDTVRVYADLPLPHSMTGRIKWQVGRTYAVQPGRGQKAVGRIRITDIREEDIRQISIFDVQKEGFDSQIAFLETWTRMHDPRMSFNQSDDGMFRYYANRRDKWVAVDETAFWTVLSARPAERYRAWVLSFEVVR